MRNSAWSAGPPTGSVAHTRDEADRPHAADGQLVDRALQGGEPVAEIGTEPQRGQGHGYSAGRVTAAATPSIASRAAALGLCTTTLARVTASSARHASAMSAAIVSIRS